MIDKNDLIIHKQTHGIVCCNHIAKTVFDLILHLREVHGCVNYENIIETFRKHYETSFYQMYTVFKNGLKVRNNNNPLACFSHIKNYKDKLDEWSTLLKWEIEKEIQTKYVFKINVAYLTNENLSAILQRLWHKIGIHIYGCDVLKAKRSNCKQSIVVEGRYAHFKQHIRKHADGKTIQTMDLISLTSSLCANTHVQIDFL